MTNKYEIELKEYKGFKYIAKTAKAEEKLKPIMERLLASDEPYAVMREDFEAIHANVPYFRISDQVKEIGGRKYITEDGKRRVIGAGVEKVVEMMIAQGRVGVSRHWGGFDNKKTKG